MEPANPSPTRQRLQLLKRRLWRNLTWRMPRHTAVALCIALIGNHFGMVVGVGWAFLIVITLDEILWPLDQDGEET